MELTETLTFLNELKVHNNKAWFDEHRTTYQGLRLQFLNLVQNIIEGITEFDDDLMGVEANKCVFRINRDLRFSKDKSPYKCNFGALMGENGKKSNGTGYYIHIEPDNSFLGGGIYRPPTDKLAAIRQEIDYNASDLDKIIETQEFKETFGAIKGDILKTAPKGYPKDHPNIALLRLKSFYVVKHFDDKQVQTKGFFKDAINTYKEAQKFNKFLNQALGKK